MFHYSILIIENHSRQYFHIKITTCPVRLLMDVHCVVAVIKTPNNDLEVYRKKLMTLEILGGGGIFQKQSGAENVIQSIIKKEKLTLSGSEHRPKRYPKRRGKTAMCHARAFTRDYTVYRSEAMKSEEFFM